MVESSMSLAIDRMDLFQKHQNTYVYSFLLFHNTNFQQEVEIHALKNKDPLILNSQHNECWSLLA